MNNTNGKTRSFHSCFAVDASVSGAEAVITDSMRMKWRADLSDEGVKAGFKTWLRNVFLRGVAQTLTVFEYEERGEDPDQENWITKFCNLPEQRVDG